MDVEEAVRLVNSGNTITIGGVVGFLLAEKVLSALEVRFLTEGEPRDLVWLDPTPTGAGPNAEHLAHEGMLKRYIGSSFTPNPGVVALALANKIECYCFPLGSLHFLVRQIAGGGPFYLTQAGLYTSFDPRSRGGKLNDVTKEELVRIVEIEGHEWLCYKAFPINVAIICGTVADEDGNISVEEEPLVLGIFHQALAAKNSGGKVIAQVKRIVASGAINPKAVIVPKTLVDAIVVDEQQAQNECYPDRYIAGLNGAPRVPVPPIGVLPLDADKVIARRAALELGPGHVICVGAGVPMYTMMPVTREEQVQDLITVTVEQGVWGGISFGSTVHINPDFITSYDATFNLYLGGGLDSCFLGFLQVDREGNLNLDRVGSRIAGAGGSMEIAHNTRKVVFCGTFTDGGLRAIPEGGRLTIASEGRNKKFVNQVEWTTFNGREMRRRGQEVLFITERAVLALERDGLVVKEIAPGVDLENDILKQMEPSPLVSPDLKVMDRRLFEEAPLNLRLDMTGHEAAPPAVGRILAKKEDASIFLRKKSGVED